MTQTTQSYEGVGSTLEEAIRAAHEKVPRMGEMHTSTVSEIEISSGGFTGQTTFRVRVDGVQL